MIPKGSTGRLRFRIADCLKNMSSSSFLSCVCISFSWSSRYCCKGSLGGIAMEAISSIILSLLDKSVPRGCLENLENLNSYGSPLNSTETLPFLQSIIAPQVLRKGLQKMIGQKLYCTEPSTRKSLGYFTFPQSTSISLTIPTGEIAFICKMDSNVYVLDLTRLNFVHDLLIKCEGNSADAGS